MPSPCCTKPDEIAAEALKSDRSYRLPHRSVGDEIGLPQDYSKLYKNLDLVASPVRNN